MQCIEASGASDEARRSGALEDLNVGVKVSSRDKYLFEGSV